MLAMPVMQVKGSHAPAPIEHWSDIAKHPKDEQDADHQQNEQHQHQHPPKKQKKQAAASSHQQPVLLGRKLMQHLSDNGWDIPTPIQRQAVPALLGGRDLLAIAPTGSGKTLAFVLPMLALLSEQKQQGGEHWPAAPKALLLSPTHELAAQTARVLKLLLPGTGLRCCLLNKNSAVGSDFSKVDVLVANPLRLKGLVEGGKVDLSKVGSWISSGASYAHSTPPSAKAKPNLRSSWRTKLLLVAAKQHHGLASTVS